MKGSYILGASSWMNWIVNEHGCWVPLLLNFVIEFRYYWQPNVEATSVFIATRRLEKHSILSFICFKLLGRYNIFTFSLLVFFIFHDFLCVLWLPDRSWHFFSIWFLACVFWHTVFIAFVFGIYFLEHMVCFKKNFVSIILR